MIIAPRFVRQGSIAGATPPPPAATTPAPARAIGPVQPVTKTREYIAGHLGLAADALAAASRRWDRPPYQVTGNYLEQAVQYLDDILPELGDYLGGYPDLLAGVSEASGNASTLSQQYLANRLPLQSGPNSTPLMLARSTYAVRAAQDVLCGVGGDLRPQVPVVVRVPDQPAPLF